VVACVVGVVGVVACVVGVVACVVGVVGVVAGVVGVVGVLGCVFGVVVPPGRGMCRSAIVSNASQPTPIAALAVAMPTPRHTVVMAKYFLVGDNASQRRIASSPASFRNFFTAANSSADRFPLL